MDKDFVNQLAQEWKDLGNEFDLLEKEHQKIAARKEEILAKRKALEPVLVAYGASMIDGAMKSIKQLISPSVQAPQTIKKRVLDRVSDILSDGKPRSTKQLLMLVEESGIHLGGTNQSIYLAVMMNKSGRYESNRATGWTLKNVKAEKS